MQIGQVNLRAGLSQAWVIWTLFACGVAVYGILFVMQTLEGWNGGGGIWVVSWLWANVLLIGVILTGAGGRAQATMTPFSYTLPGYWESLRHSSLGRAVRAGAVFSLVLFSNAWHRMYMRADWPPDMPQPSVAVGAAIPELSLTVVGAFLAGMAICLLWIAGGSMVCWRPWLAVLFLAIGLAIGHVAWFPAARHPFAIWPVLVPLSLLLCAYSWRRLGDREWVRNGHRAIILYRVKVAGGVEVRTPASSQVEGLFRYAMRGSSSTASARHLWGWLYRAFGPILTQWRWIFVSLLVGVVVLGYLNRFFADVGFVLLGLCIAGSVWLTSSALPLPEGRREKGYLTVVSAVLATLLLVGISAGVVVLSWFFAAVLPPVSLGMLHLRYTGLSMRNVWLACLPVPWFPAVATVFALLLLSVRMVWPLMILGTLSFVVGILSVGRGILHLHLDSALLPVWLACGWVYFLLRTWLNYRRRDQADQ